MSQEEHAMDKPKKLEVQTDGDLTEIKKDPIWKTFLEKKQYRIERGKRVKLGDLTDYKLPKGQKGAKHKEVKEQTKIRWRKPLKKRGEDMGDRVIQPPKEDKEIDLSKLPDEKRRLNLLTHLAETPSGVNPRRPDVNVQDDLGDKVVHPQTKKPGIVPVQEGKEPQSTTPSGLAGPMGRSEDKRRGGYRRGGAMPINLALTQLVKFKIFGGIRQRRVDRKERDRVSAAAHGPSGKKPAGIPESPGNIDNRKAPKPKDESKRKITATPFALPEKPKQALPKDVSLLGAGGKVTAEREAKPSDPAMGYQKPKKTTSPIQNIERSVDAYILWKRALDETGESDVNQAKGVKLREHHPLGSEEYEVTDADGNVEIKRRKIVREEDKPHKVADPLHPYTMEPSGGFIIGGKKVNLIDSDQNVLGQTPGNQDREVQPRSGEPIKSPKVADPKKRTNVPKSLEDITKPIPDSKGGKGSFQHCINTNQDKHNPGGWCKQIERKIGKAKKDTWNCSLCNIELPDDELSEERKKRHADFHVDESVQTGGRQRNWTFGDAKFTLGKQKAWKSWLGKTLQRDMEEKEPLGSKETDAEILSGMKRPYKTRPGSSALTQRQVGEPGKLRRAIHHPKIGHKDRLREIWEKKHPTHLLGGEYGTKRTGGKPKKEIERKEFMQGKEHGDHPFNYYSERNQKIHEGVDALKTDYFVEEIRANIIYENKIAPLIGMLAGGVARAVGGIGKKVVQAGKEMAVPQEGEEEE